MVEFGGWMMPVSYTTVLTEHHAVRRDAGMFDVSHMGEVLVQGKGALEFLQKLTTNDVSSLAVGRGQYSLLLNEEGGTVDDLILYRLDQDRYLLCVNASNTDKDYAWIAKYAASASDVSVLNDSPNWAQLAVQGPASREVVISALAPASRPILGDLPYMGIVQVELCGAKVWIARTGYTGEMGYEIYLPSTAAVGVWRHLLEMGKPKGLVPCGLGARDTLRLEACYVLYGNELGATISPIEAGVAWAVKTQKPEFVGRKVVSEQRASGPKRKVFAFTMTDNAVPRHGMKVFHGNEEVGEVTSGSVLPTVGGSGGMAILRSDLVAGAEVEIDVRGKRKLAKLVSRPLYSPRIK